MMTLLVVIAMFGGIFAVEKSIEIIKNGKRRWPVEKTLRSVMTTPCIVCYVLVAAIMLIHQYQLFFTYIPEGTYTCTVAARTSSETDYHLVPAVIEKDHDYKEVEYHQEYDEVEVPVYHLLSIEYNGKTYNMSDVVKLEEGEEIKAEAGSTVFTVKMENLTAKALGVNPIDVFKSTNILDRYAPALFVISCLFNLGWILSKKDYWLQRRNQAEWY